jgi:hemerythrin
VLVWSPENELGIPRIDRQHETFVDLVNDFESARLGNASKEELLGILNEIALFAKFHFCCEENLMQKIGCPCFEEQREKHQRGIDTLSNLIFRVTLELAPLEEIERVLWRWFFDHTANEDKKIAEFMKRSS